MRIKRLVLKNIRSYKLSEIVFPKGSILLSGDVGAGKTTILLAIEYALFGLQPGQRGSSLLSHNASEGRVELEMEINNDLVLIERTLRRSSKTINQDYAAITINGTKQELAVTELKLKILELLGYPEEFVKKTNVLYRYTVYSPQEEMKQIILDDPDSRLDTLRHIFGIDRYRNIQENLALVTVKLREKTKLVQGELKDI
ncbi:MAG: SMC family ATPase, partial [Nanoarchaeota archaeon]